MKGSNQDVLHIAYNNVPKVLMLGNGINRAYSFASWDDLIRSIQTRELSEDDMACVKKIPYPMQPVILTNDHLGTRMRDISGALSALRAAESEEALLQKYASLPVAAVLTTNYSYEFEKALDAGFKCIPGRRCRHRKAAYSETGKYEIEQLHTYYALRNGSLPVWHIHGEASRPDTMVLGHYYYGKLLAKMQRYISVLIARYKSSVSRQQPMEVHSWIDYFMLGEVHIVGLGMALSEMDLWWLINCKKQHFGDRKTVLYKPDILPEEKLLAEDYGVEVNQSGYHGNYEQYYQFLVEHLKGSL